MTTGQGMKQRDPARWHTIYSIISTVVEEMAIAALIIWVLPLFGINLPLWALAAVLVAFAIFSYIMYRIGHPTITFRKVSAPESIIGSAGVVETALDPGGMVKVRGELWKARSAGGPIDKGEDVTISSVEGLTLVVDRKKEGIR